MAKATYTVTELAERWECSPHTVLSHIHSGALPAFNVATAARSSFRVKTRDVERFESARAAKPDPVPVPVNRRRLPHVEPTFR